MTRCTTPFLGGFVIAILFSACDFCETKGTVTLILSQPAIYFDETLS